LSPPDDDSDDDRTIIRPPSQRAAAAPLGHMLPLGTHLLDYEITGLIGEGGFGIVYLAWDHSLQRKVAIKEYMPASMASRIAGSSAIVVKSERHLDTFKAGLKSFMNEARLLARFDHRALVKVYRFWEENGTAYMAMPFYEGPTLKSALTQLGQAPSEGQLRGWLAPLLDALTVMHAAQCFHRDIAPDNVLLTATGPLLLDFGAARRVIGDMTHALTVVLKPGYAPIEQYGDVASMTQGAWTDIYALACVVYYAITGKTPMSSVERLMDDRLVPLAEEAKGRYGDGFLRAIDAALAVRPQDRPQNAPQFRALLDIDLPASPPSPPLSGYGALSHDSFPRTEEGGYSTVPGTLTPELATQWQPRPAEPAPAVPAEPAAHEVPQAAPVAPPAVAVPAQAAPPRPPPRALPAATATARPASQAAAAGNRALLLGAAVLLIVSGLAFAVYLALQANEDDAVKPSAPAASAALGPASAVSATVPAVAPPASATVPEATSPASAVAPPASAAPAVAAPATSAAAEVASSPLPSASAAAAAPRPSPTSRAEPSRPAPVEPSASPRRAPPAAASAAPRPRPEPPAETRSAPGYAPSYSPGYAPTTPPASPYARGARCSDILQKASLEPLTAEEAAYLKRECR